MPDLVAFRFRSIKIALQIALASVVVRGQNKSKNSEKKLTDIFAGAQFSGRLLRGLILPKNMASWMLLNIFARVEKNECT